MLRYIGIVIDRVFGISGALICSQIPLFIEQYVYRLSGHAAELKYQTAAMEEAAFQSNLSLSEYIQKFVVNTDSDFSTQGRLMEAMLERQASFMKGLTALQNSSPGTKFFVFLNHFHQSIVKETFENFQPGLLFTTETLIYAMCGTFLGYLLYLLLVKCFTRLVYQ